MLIVYDFKKKKTARLTGYGSIDSNLITTLCDHGHQHFYSTHTGVVTSPYFTGSFTVYDTHKFDNFSLFFILKEKHFFEVFLMLLRNYEPSYVKESNQQSISQVNSHSAIPPHHFSSIRLVFLFYFR